MEPENIDRESKYIVFAMIFLLANKLQAIGDSFFDDISTKQWFVLVVLGIMNGYSPTLNELSDAVGSSHQNVKQLVLKLEQKGYVELSKDEKDSRRLRIKATPKVDEFSRIYHQKSEAFMESLFGQLEESDLITTKNVMLSMRQTLERMGKEYDKEQ